MKAIFSLYDKKDCEIIASALLKKGFDIVATEGTHKYLLKYNIPSITVEEYTSFSPTEDGRVKTLSNKIFKEILLADGEIYFVVVDLYPFIEEMGKSKDMVELIDIGGVALIRAGAKNYNRVAVVIDKRDYKSVAKLIEKEAITLKERKRLALKAFTYTSFYDRNIATYFSMESSLKYGENPHQKAGFLNEQRSVIELISANSLGYNNMLDTDALTDLLFTLGKGGAAVLKHTTPCGAAVHSDVYEALRLAHESDRISAFGGIFGIYGTVDVKIAKYLKPLFIEVIAATGFKAEALDILKKKKRLKIVKWYPERISHGYEYRSALNGMLFQEKDSMEDEGNFKVVSKREPGKDEWEAMRFAWSVVKSVKSNAIVIAGKNYTVGIGSGQPNRVGSVKIAIEQLNLREKLSPPLVLASDGFFPFKDSIEILRSTPVSAVIEPGGSIRDKEVIQACDEMNLALIFTNYRHFRH